MASDEIHGTSPSTWNPHLPKLVTNGEWSYASFYRTSPRYGEVAWLYRRNEGSGWDYADRVINYPRQPPGLALDTEDKLHVVFNCEAGGLPCVSGGASSGTWDRFYDLIFYDHNPDSSVHVGTPDAYWNYDEFIVENRGYMGIGTDPAGSRTYVSLANTWSPPEFCQYAPSRDSDVGQLLFDVGQLPGVAEAWQASKQFPRSSLLYPQIAVSPTGTRYYSVGELNSPCWTTSAEYKGVSLYQVPQAGFPATASFSDSVANPGPDPSDPSNPNLEPPEWAFHSDMSFAPDGRLYFLYFKKPPDANGNCSYLVKETAAGSGTFGPKQPVGCYSNWAQLQIDSSGRLYIVEEVGGTRNLAIHQSDDDGTTWTTATRTIPRAGNALPSGSAAITGTSLVKPWSSPAGYDPDLLHGVVANLDGAVPPTPKTSWSMVEFRIPINP